MLAVTPPSRPESRNDTVDTVAIFGYVCLCLNALFFSSLLAAYPSTFQALSREDYWVENLTAVWFLLAGILLFVTAFVERGLLRRCIYILGGMAMVFAAGEEISWGQRIFGFTTPDLLMQLNEQQEFTVHNFANKSFDIIYLNGTLILCMTTSAAFFCGRDRILNIPLPSIPLMLSFLIVLSYESGANLRELGELERSGGSFRDYLVGIKRSFGFIVIEEKGLLLLFLIFALLARHVKLVIASATTLTLVLALTYVNYVNYHGDVGLGSVYEVREYLFAIGCLFYCLEIKLGSARGRGGGQTNSTDRPRSSD